jgi:hypothetical protein
MVKADKAVTRNALVCLLASLTEVKLFLRSFSSCLLRRSVVRNPASYSEGPEFNTRSRDWLF